MTNTSATGGYLSPTNTALPGDLTLTQYLQNVIVGITGMVSTAVRPKWQAEPPKQFPNPTDNWCAFAVMITNPDANLYVEEVNDESRTQRHEDLSVICSFYGSLSNENAGILRDGFSISQNRDALSIAGIGFTGTSGATFVPEFINNRWFPRTDITVMLKRRVDRTYSILPFIEAGCNIDANRANEEILTASWIANQGV
jgi:hypothetical protein